MADMLGDASPGGRGVAHHQESRHGATPNHAYARSPERAAPFDRASQACRRRRDDGLDLDDQERTRGWVEREDVDDPALAIDVERDLGRHLPAGSDQVADDRLDEPGMRLVAQSVEPFALEQHANGQRAAKRCNGWRRTDARYPVAPPASISEIHHRERPMAVASRSWLQPRRRRSRRMSPPSRTGSMDRC